jgi:hypothetical protein
MRMLLLRIEEAELAANHITLFSGYRDFSSIINHVLVSAYSEGSSLILDLFLGKWLQMLLEIEYHVLVHSHHCKLLQNR